jgi:hypothetical protein
VARAVSAQRSVSLFEDVAQRPVSSFLVPTTSYYRPLFYVALSTLWHGAGSIDRGLALIKLLLHILPLTVLVVAFIANLRPRSALDAAAATVATAVLIGSPGLLDNLELPLSYTLVGMPIAVIVWMLLERERRSWHGPLILALTIVAVGFKEHGPRRRAGDRARVVDGRTRDRPGNRRDGHGSLCNRIRDLPTGVPGRVAVVRTGRRVRLRAVVEHGTRRSGLARSLCGSTPTARSARSPTCCSPSRPMGHFASFAPGSRPFTAMALRVPVLVGRDDDADCVVGGNGAAALPTIRLNHAS